jgi:hypothetical protein
MILDLQTGKTQDENNRQDNLFEEIPNTSELLVRFRLSFEHKKLFVSLNDAVNFRPAFRIFAGNDYVPVVAFASAGCVQVIEMNVKQ